MAVKAQDDNQEGQGRQKTMMRRSRFDLRGLIVGVECLVDGIKRAKRASGRVLENIA